MKCQRSMEVLLSLRSIFSVFAIFLNSRIKLEKHIVCWLILVIQAGHLAADLQDDIVFVRENETAELQWSLFGENARSSVNVMIKNRDALLCQWVKGHWEINQCDPGMNLTISPEQVRVPGPTNITATFSFKNKGRVDDGTYVCLFVIDDKWKEIQVYPKYLVTTVEPNVSVTYSNKSKTDTTCHVRGGRPRPVETILIKNGTEISRSRLICSEEAGDTDGNEASYCSSIYSVENSGGQYKCRVEQADYIVDSTEVDIPFRTKENETSAPCPAVNDCKCASAAVNDIVILLASIVSALMVWVVVLVYLHILTWQRRKQVNIYVAAAEKSYGPDFGNGQAKVLLGIV